MKIRKPESFSYYLHNIADVHDKKARNYNMSQIRSGNTKPELLLRKFLHAQGPGDNKIQERKINYDSVLFSPLFKNGFSRSMGTGNMVVEFFSVAISRKVCR